MSRNLKIVFFSEPGYWDGLPGLIAATQLGSAEVSVPKAPIIDRLVNGMKSLTTEGVY